jgi:uroporphyrinogen-III synthase
MLRVLGYLDSGTGKTRVLDRESKGGTFVVTIGPTTRDYLKNTFGFEPDVCAEKPSLEGLIDGISKFLSKRAGGG